MNKQVKKVLSIVATLAMLISSVQMPVFAYDVSGGEENVVYDVSENDVSTNETDVIETEDSFLEEETEEPLAGETVSGILKSGDVAYSLSGTKLTLSPTEYNTDLVLKRSDTFANLDFYGNTVVYSPSDITEVVLKGFKKIDSEALSYDMMVTGEGFSNLKKVSLPDELEEIDDNAFSYTILENVTLPDKLQTIGAGAFSYTSLTSISIPESVKTIGMCAFYDTKLASVEFHEGLTDFGSSVFEECNNLKSLVFPDSVTSIGSLEGINNLESVSMPISAKRDGNYSFPNSLKKVTFTVGNGTYAYGELEELKIFHKSVSVPYEVIFGEGITYIKKVAFKDDKGITKVTIPSTVTLIEEDAFEFCENLKEVVFTEGKTARKLTFGSERGNGAFSGCKALKKVEFPKDITDINAFPNHTFCDAGVTDAYFRNPNVILHFTHEPGTCLFEEGTKLHAYSWDYSKIFMQIYDVSVEKYCKEYPEFKFVSLGKAPEPAKATGIQLDQERIVKYASDLEKGENFDVVLKVTPKNAEEPEITVSVNQGDDESVIEQNGEGVYNSLTGEYTYNFKYTGKLGINTICFTLHAKTSVSKTFTVTVKDKDQAIAPKLKLISSVHEGKLTVGDQYALTSESPNAQIFYFISNYSADVIFGEHIEWSEEKGKFVSSLSECKEYTKPLVAGEDLKYNFAYLSAVVVRKDLKMSDVAHFDLNGDYLNTAAIKEEEWGDITEEERQKEFGGFVNNFLNNKKYRGIWAPMYQLEDPDRVYTGKSLTIPDLRIYYGNKLLVKNKDYTLKYVNSVRATTSGIYKVDSGAHIDITLKGNYSGTAKLYYMINPVKASELKMSDINLKAKKDKNGELVDLTLDPKITYKGYTLKKGKDKNDFNCDYRIENIQYRATTDETWKDIDTVKEPGLYSVKVKYYGNFSGEEMYYDVCVVTGEAESASVIPVSSVTIKKISDQKIVDWPDYTVKPEISVSYKAKGAKSALTIDKDWDLYRVKYENNTSIGTGTVIITGTGKVHDGLSFIGTKKVTFKITGTKLTKNNVKVEGLSSSYDYTHGPIIPEITVKCGGTTLTSDDYYLTYGKKGNVNAGKVEMIINGRNGYTGSVKKTFNILPNELTDQDTFVFLTGDYVNWTKDREVRIPYSKSGAKVSIEKVYAKNSRQSIIHLEEGKDYKVSYANNKAVRNYLSVDRKGKSNAPTLTITFMGNYKGTLTRSFTIEPKDLSDFDAFDENGVSITLKDMLVSSSAGKCFQKPVLKDKKGNTLKAGTDYENSIIYTYDEDVTVKTKSGKKTVSVLRLKGDVVDKKDIIPAGAVIRVTVTGKNNYMGVTSGTFNIAPANISTFKFKIAEGKSYIYAGSAITPSKDDIVVQRKVGKNWVDIPAEEAKEYFDITGYSNNVKSSNKAVITITGKNGYAGTATVKFTIDKKN
ncbi:MAG: leucine-rich repeat domain-containing protein [Lachnospiraceae bacterium]|nr:leucine-rich repeat domain-containing protein [Lachnospiraceae bacterium]